MKHALILTVAAAMAATAQTKAGPVPPREIDKAARRVDQAWKLWQQARPEPKLLERPAHESLAEINKSEAHARKYLEGKQAYYKLVADSFRGQALALLASSTDNPAKLAETRKEHVKRLANQSKETRAEMDRLAKDASDPRGAALRVNYMNQLTHLDKLQTEARQQAEHLAESAKTAAAEEEARRELAGSLRNVAEAVDQLAETASIELDHWSAYHRELRTLVESAANRGQNVGPRVAPSFTEGLDAIEAKGKRP